MIVRGSTRMTAAIRHPTAGRYPRSAGGGGDLVQRLQDVLEPAPFATNPDAPAPRAARSTPSSAWAVRITTGRSGVKEWIRCIASMPEMSGIDRSIRTTSGWSSFASMQASSPPAASPATSMSPTRRRAEASAFRNAGRHRPLPAPARSRSLPSSTPATAVTARPARPTGPGGPGPEPGGRALARGTRGAWDRCCQPVARRQRPSGAILLVRTVYAGTHPPETHPGSEFFRRTGRSDGPGRRPGPWRTERMSGWPGYRGCWVYSPRWALRPQRSGARRTSGVGRGPYPRAGRTSRGLEGCRRMFERFTDRARRVVVLAQEEARMLNHTTSAPSTSCSG